MSNAERIRSLLEKTGCSQRQLAREWSLTRGNVVNWLGGVNMPRGAQVRLGVLESIMADVQASDLTATDVAAAYVLEQRGAGPVSAFETVMNDKQTMKEIMAQKNDDA